MYLYQLEKWPNFTWDQEKINALLIPLRHLQGRLIGGMDSVGFHLQEETLLKTLTQDVVKSSEIEGEILDPSSVRSSIARRLGIEVAALDPVDRNVEGVVEMMLDATQKFDQPLIQERLFGWHAALFPTGRSGMSKIRVGEWRKGPVFVVSGRMGKETVHFEAPEAERVEHEMELFLNWINQNTAIDLVLKAAIAHLWFVTIHPFDDGNGRIGRAIADLLLARSENSFYRFYSLSAQIQLQRKEYYDILEKTQKGKLDITPWIQWFFNCLDKAMKSALSTQEAVLQKKRFWEGLAGRPLNERQRRVINLLLDNFQGKLTSSKWAKLTKCSQDTAYRDIVELVNQGILAKSPEGGRSQSYFLIKQEGQHL